MSVTNVYTLNPKNKEYDEKAEELIGKGYVKTNRTTTHYHTDYSYDDDGNLVKGETRPVEMEVWHNEIFVGAVFATRERNFYHDSDFYAVVWDGEKITSYEYATTRFAGGGFASVDATDEVKAAATAYLEKWIYGGLVAANETNARTPEKGRTVEVVKGRKVAKGTTGEVIWYGKGRKFSPSKWETAPMRVGIKDADGEVHWTNADNVEVVNPGQYELTDEELREIARNRAGRTPFHAPVSGGPGMVVL